MPRILILLSFIALFLCAACESKEEAPAAADKAQTEGSADKGTDPTKPVLVKQPGAKAGDTTLCPIMGGEFVVSDKQPSVDHKGQPVYFCCPGCDKKFLADPEKHLEKLNTDIDAENAKRGS